METVETAPAKHEPSPRTLDSNTVNDLRLQIRELTHANQDLRNKLSEQAAEMDALKETLTRIQRDLNQAKTKGGNRRSAPVP
jgi:predicted RNase H-like nuclease (RuvC/YqgF family)